MHRRAVLNVVLQVAVLNRILHAHHVLCHYVIEVAQVLRFTQHQPPMRWKSHYNALTHSSHANSEVLATVDKRMQLLSIILV